MSLKLQTPCNLVPSSSSNIQSSCRESGGRGFHNETLALNKVLFYRGYFKQSFRIKFSEHEKGVSGSRSLEFRTCRPSFQKTRRTPHSIQSASTDDGVTVNGTPHASSSGEVLEMRVKLDQSLHGEDPSSGLIQSLHDAARSIELAVLDHSSSSKTFWFSKAWLGIDKNAWVKTLSYQAAVYSFLQAAIEISSRGERRDRDVNIFVQRSLMRLSAPLESVMREELSTKQPASFDWFWSQQHPMVVTSFVNLLERDSHFSAATTECWKGMSTGSRSASDLPLVMLALSCIAAVTKLGPTKLSCSQFISIVPDITGRLMDMMVDFVPMRHAYSSIKEIGLHREFLLHFGPRAASCRVNNDQDIEEIAFWVDLIQKQLHQAIDRERIWSRLTTCESIEVLEKDLAIFGFFIALGRSTQIFLSANGYSVTDNQIQSIVRYFIGGSVLYYPQLSSISSYQLYVEVVCEELEWLPLYGVKLVAPRLGHENKSQEQGLPYGKVVSQILDVCSHWTTSFIKYSQWLENPSNVKAARFLSRGHSKLKEHRQESGAVKKKTRETISEEKVRRTGSDSYFTEENDRDTFDKALESVEEAINRLEGLLQELHLSNSSTGKEHLKVVCSDLESLRKLKKEAEFLEASFRAKAASLEEGKYVRNVSINDESGFKSADRPWGLWSFLSRHFTSNSELEISRENQKENDISLQISSSGSSDQKSETNGIRRFEALRQELIELEKRVKRSTDEYPFDEEGSVLDNRDDYPVTALVKPPIEENIIANSIEKLKETGTDVLQGTQLLAIDVAAAMVLIKRSLTGDELAEKERKALQRTLTDLASVFPIGILMLLPVTAVGHAAMLAAIQRYVPSLIPSTYAPERLNLLRQLEKVKAETADTKPDENEPQIS